MAHRNGPRGDLCRAQNVSQCLNILSISVKVSDLENVPLQSCYTFYSTLIAPKHPKPASSTWLREPLVEFDIQGLASGQRQERLCRVCSCHNPTKFHFFVATLNFYGALKNGILERRTSLFESNSNMQSTVNT